MVNQLDVILNEEIQKALRKAPRGKRGARGNLIHLQDPEFITDDAQLLMTRPTLGMTQLVEDLARKHGAAKTLVKSKIDQLVEKRIVFVSKTRKFEGIPKLIPIKYRKDYLTGNIGTYRNGQFAGFELWHEREISVLHLFDKFGFHVSSHAWDSKTGCDPSLELNNAIQGLFRPYPGDIAVQLFSTELLGMKFGLIKTSFDHVEYVPLLLGFDAPWNGDYDT